MIALLFSQNQSNPFIEDEDVRLMLAFQGGDKASFEKILRKFFPRILNFTYRYVNNREVAEDLTQEVFIRVYRNAHRYSPQAKLSTWLFTIAKNVSLNELRKLKRQAISLDAPVRSNGGEITRQVEDHTVEAPDQAVLKKEKSAIVMEAIQSLPEQQKMAVILRRYEQLSYEEIAKTMGTTLKAVKSLLSRAKENLKESLKNIDR